MRIVFCKIFVFVFDLIPLTVTILDVNFNFYTSFSTSPLFTVVVFLLLLWCTIVLIVTKTKPNKLSGVSDCVKTNQKSTGSGGGKVFVIVLIVSVARALFALSIWNRYSCDSNGKTKGKNTLTVWFCLSLLIWFTLLIHIYVLTVCVSVFVLVFRFSFAAHRARFYRLIVKCARSWQLIVLPDTVSYCQLVECVCL